MKKNMTYKLFTKKNIDILLFLSKNSAHIRDIADLSKISPTKVHDTVQLFKKYKLVSERKKKNMKIIELDHDSLLWKRMKQLLEME